MFTVSDDAKELEMSEKRDTAIKGPQNNPGRERTRMTPLVITIAFLVIVGVFVGLDLYISPDTTKEKQGLALVWAISTGGIAAFVGLYLTGEELRMTRKMEDARAREAALRTCLAQLGRLVTDTKWNTPDTMDTKDQAGSTLRELAQAEVLSVLGTLDGPRKRILVRFLFESKLLNKENPTLDLDWADLSKAELNGSKLPDVALSGVRQIGANLSGANLSGANLSEADLSEAILSGANLSEADLSNANLVGGALSNTNLSAATVTDEQLQAANSLEGAIMPD